MDRSNRQARTPGSTFAALASRNYRLYWFGLICYVLGHRAEYVTFAWMVWEVSGDPLYLGYLGLAQGAPLVGRAATTDPRERRRRPRTPPMS